MGDGERPPIRIVTRLLAQMQTSVVASGVRTLNGDLDRFMVFSLVLRQTMSGGAVIPISTLAIANSLGRPYETVRRHVHALIGLGFCARVPQGIIAPPTALECPAVAGLLTLTHDWFVRFVADMGVLSVPLPQQRNVESYHPSVGMNAVADMLLAVADGNRAVHRDWEALVLFSTILCANTRGYVLDPELAQRYRDEHSAAPESIRLPVRSSVVARVSGIGETTVRRRIAAMLDEGVLQRTSRGLLVEEAWLNRPLSVETSRGSYQSIRRVLDRASAAGFPFENPAAAYLIGRPADPSFD